MATKIEENVELAKIYDNGTKSLSGSDGSSLARKSNESYITLKTEMSKVISRLDINTWDDAISAEINQSTKTGLETLIDACKSPADEIMIQAGNNVEMFNNGFVNYRQKVIDHNNKVDEVNTAESNLGTEPSEKIKVKSADGKSEETVDNPEYAAYQGRFNELNRLKGELDTLSSEVNTWEKYCSGVVENIRGVLAPIESTVSAAALSATFGTVSNYDRESAEKYGYGNDYYVSGTRVLDPNGMLLTETYKVIGPDGKIVETGEVYYDSEGRKTSTSFYKEPPEPTTVADLEKEKEHLEQQRIPAALAYVDENAVPASETSTEKTEYTQLANGEETGYQTDKHSEATFADGTEVISDLKTIGTVVEATDEQGAPTKILVPDSSVEDAVIITEEDGTFNYHEETQFENGVRDSAVGTLSQDGTQLATVNTDYVADYSDGLTGYDVSVQNQVVATQTATTTTSSIVYKTDENGQPYSETVTLTRDNADPACGTVMYSNGEGYSVSRTESGQLEVTEYYPDKNGEIQSDTRVIDDQTTAQLSVINHETGTTEVTAINIENPLDQFVVSNSYQTARIDSGYNAYAAMDGGHHLWLCDGTEMEIQSPLESEPSYTMSLTMINE